MKKSVFMTGANGGMAKETIKILLHRGYTKIVMGARSEQKAEDAKNEISRELGRNYPGLVPIGGFDMNDPAAIAESVDQLSNHAPFDIVFLQAGGVIFDDNYQYTRWRGFQVEKTAFQNALGAFITLSHLKEKGLIAKGGRVVFAGGEGARGIPGMIEKPAFDSVNELEKYLFGGTSRKFNTMNAIGASKLMSAWLSIQLSQRYRDEFETLWFSPGLTYGTNGLAKATAIKRWFMEKVTFGIAGFLGLAQSPTKGAVKYADALEGKIGSNGDMLGAPEGGALGKITDQKVMNETITSENLQLAFWEIAQQVGGPFGNPNLLAAKSETGHMSISA